MNPNKTLRGLIVSQTRVKLVKEFFSYPKEAFYIRELTRKTGEKVNSVRRELINLENKGILQSEKRGNRVFYALNKTSPLFYPLLMIVTKVSGLGYRLRVKRARLGRIRLALFSSRFLLWDSIESEVDILVVGRVVLPEIGALIVKEEKKRGREINYAVMDWNEFRMRITNKDPFIIDFLLKGPSVVVGNEEDIFGL